MSEHDDSSEQPQSGMDEPIGRLEPFGEDRPKNDQTSLGRPEPLLENDTTPATENHVVGADSVPTPAVGVPIEHLARGRLYSDRDVRVKTRRAFLVGGAVAVAGVAGFRWLTHQPKEDGALWPLRKMLGLNESIWSATLSPDQLAPTFDRNDAAANPRVNGRLGLTGEFDPAAWSLQIVGISPAVKGQVSVPVPAGTPPGTLRLSLDDIRALPKMEMVTELKCIEGWSEIIHWGGVRFSDFMRSYAPAGSTGAPVMPEQPDELPDYVSIETPNMGYYVGMDIGTMLHPQTLLCYEINGRPLTVDHGAPLRLVAPTKYGIKNIKRIGTIRYTNVRPADYWAKQGYDWFAGL